MYDIVVYETENGHVPFDAWFDSLNVQAAPKVTTAIARMETGHFGDIKPVGHGVSERRISFGPCHRIDFGQEHPNRIILLMGGTRKQQSRDIASAQTFWTDYRKRRRRDL
ncbi:MAG: addiction module protein [Aestuariivita sp.]|nr:addiction module protein [Aestuariivita sp.]